MSDGSIFNNVFGSNSPSLGGGSFLDDIFDIFSSDSVQPSGGGFGGGLADIFGGVDSVGGSLGGFGSGIASFLTGDSLGILGMGAGIADLLGFDYSGFLEGTILAVFSDGISCWGSTFLPSEIKQEIQTIQAPYFSQLFDWLNDATTETEVVNRLNFIAEAVFTNISMYTYIQTSANWKSCSKKALKNYVTFLDNLNHILMILLVNFNQGIF
ncbi:hypothetical protein [Sediminibacter sp. Hel_I_10]|uniref:hypothetical protein n=1 Tax=Sediminibacter sp. Hel_I_10 TaxID=1392490 RepID=UPI00047AA8BF|nr:hypothetical protein [Sediminibacter sp. Hel_I_10]